MSKQLQNIQQTTILDVELQFALDNDVWFNATKMVKNFNEANGTKKDLSNFWKSSETKEYMKILEEELANVNSTVAPENNGLKHVINNGDHTNGTYIHPELGILLARYLSPKFARACDKFIKETLLNKNKQPQINQQELATTISTAVVQAMMTIMPNMNQETELDKEEKQLRIDILKIDKINKIAELSEKYNLEEIGSVSSIPSDMLPQLKKLTGSTIKEVRPAINGISPTACIKMSELNLKPHELYKMMLDVQVVTQYEMPHYTKGTQLKWKLTDIGRYYGYNRHSSSVKELPYQILLYPDRFGELLDLIRNEGLDL